MSTPYHWSDPSPGEKAGIDAEIVSGGDADEAGELAVIDSEIATAATAAAAAGTDFFDAGNSGAALTLDYRNGSTQQVTLTGSAPTITLSHLPAGKYANLRLLLKQDATGTRLLPTFSPAADYGTPGAPVLTVTAAKTDVLDLFSVDGSTVKAVLVVKGL